MSNKTNTQIFNNAARRQEYCLVNVNGVKSKPLCRPTAYITKAESDRGERITRFTLGLNQSAGRKTAPCMIHNVYTFDRHKILFVFAAYATAAINDNMYTGAMNIELRLDSVVLMDKDKVINHKLHPDDIPALISQINDQLKGLMSGVDYIEVNMIKQLFPERFNKLFEYLTKLIQIPNGNFRVTETLSMNPTDIALKIDLK